MVSPQIVEHNLPMNKQATENATAATAATLVLECPNAGKGVTTVNGTTPLYLPVLVTCVRAVRKDDDALISRVALYDSATADVSSATPIAIVPVDAQNRNGLLVKDLVVHQRLYAVGYLDDDTLRSAAADGDVELTLTYYPIRNVGPADVAGSHLPSFVERADPRNVYVKVDATSAASSEAVTEAPNAGRATTTVGGATPLQRPIYLTEFELTAEDVGFTHPGTRVSLYDSASADVSSLSPVAVVGVPDPGETVRNAPGEVYVFGTGIRAVLSAAADVHFNGTIKSPT